MRVTATALQGVWAIDTDTQPDARGSFTRLLCVQALAQAGIDFVPQQISMAHNTHTHTLRGLHWQTTPDETKLVLCISGSAYDVAVDMRPQSPTYLQHVARTLQAGQGLLLAPQFAHGYLTLQPNTTLLYAMQGIYNAHTATGARYNDPALAIAWPHAPAVISARDACWGNCYLSIT